MSCTSIAGRRRRRRARPLHVGRRRADHDAIRGATSTTSPGICSRACGSSYYDAGHILGSALTTFEFEQNGRSFQLGMRRRSRPTRIDRSSMDPEVHPAVGRAGAGEHVRKSHPSGARTRPSDVCTEIVQRTLRRGGRVLVPAFAVGRTQEVVATIHRLCELGELCDLPIFVDSPMARQATAGVHAPSRAVRRRDAARLRARARRAARLRSAALRRAPLTSRSRSTDRTEPCIIIAASGMAEGGRILHHLQHGLGDARNTVLFVGFQAEGTLGRRIVDRAEVVNVFGEPVRVRAEVASLQGFSAHADQSRAGDVGGAPGSAASPHLPGPRRARGRRRRSASYCTSAPEPWCTFPSRGGVRAVELTQVRYQVGQRLRHPAVRGRVDRRGPYGPRPRGAGSGVRRSAPAASRRCATGRSSIPTVTRARARARGERSETDGTTPRPRATTRSPRRGALGTCRAMR